MDYVRFPLIYPYEVMNADFGDEKWIINLNGNIPFYGSVYKVSQIAVEKDIIMAYTDRTDRIFNDEAALQWFVLIPSKKIEVGFSSELEFKKYIHNCGVSDFLWWNVRDAYKKFKKTECLPWIPGCNETQ